MVQIVVIPKSGEPEQASVRDATQLGLARKVGLKSDSGFAKRVVWRVGSEGNTLYVGLYAKDTGNAGRENKCDLPPPIDTQLYFGKLAIVAARDQAFSDVVDFPVEMWSAVYEKLFGGFENIEDTDDEEETEDEVDPEMLTKHGYEKDGFVVDDSEASAERTESEQDESEYDSELSADEYEAEDPL